MLKLKLRPISWCFKRVELVLLEIQIDELHEVSMKKICRLHLIEAISDEEVKSSRFISCHT